MAACGVRSPTRQQGQEHRPGQDEKVHRSRQGSREGGRHSHLCKTKERHDWSAKWAECSGLSPVLPRRMPEPGALLCSTPHTPQLSRNRVPLAVPPSLGRQHKIRRSSELSVTASEAGGRGLAAETVPGAAQPPPPPEGRAAAWYTSTSPAPPGFSGRLQNAPETDAPTQPLCHS